MYRYTEKKNQQANQKQAARRRARQTQKTSAKKVVSTTVARRKKTTSARRRPNPAVSAAQVVKKNQAKQRRLAEIIERGASLATFVLAVVFLGVLILGIYVILMNNYFPRHFRIDQEKTILLVDASINERADNLYLLRLDPVTSRVTVAVLPGSMEVDLVGQYKRYPLSSVSPLVYRYSESLQEVKAAYNFALGMVLDEFYFVPGAREVTTRAGLQQLLQNLILDDWKRTSQWDRDLIADYFALRSSKYFTLEQVRDIADLSGKNTTASRSQLVHCQLRIYNAAAADGLARRVSEMLTGDGVNVIKLETANEKIDQSTIYYDETQEDCVRLVEILQANLPKGVTAIGDGGEVARAQRAGAVLYLGEELAN